MPARNAVRVGSGTSVINASKVRPTVLGSVAASACRQTGATLAPAGASTGSTGARWKRLRGSLKRRKVIAIAPETNASRADAFAAPASRASDEGAGSPARP